MNRREKELLLMMAETELQNLKVILELRKSTASQNEVDTILDKIWKTMQDINEMKKALKQ